ncbi:MAG: hypothetical protein KJ069_16365 [Anaerolineae bacterium]|nr:hypothetical protein [Anaerolineae bacterium]
MNNRKLFIAYLKGLIKQWYVAVTLILEIVGLLILGTDIPFWIYLALFGVVFIIANFLLYREQQLNVLGIEEEYGKKVESLLERIAELENRIPKLELFFRSNEGFTKNLVVSVLPQPDQMDFDALLQSEEELLKQAIRPKELTKNLSENC